MVKVLGALSHLNRETRVNFTPTCKDHAVEWEICSMTRAAEDFQQSREAIELT